MGASGPKSETLSRWRVLASSLAGQGKTACSWVSGASLHMGQVVGRSLSHAWWPRRQLFPDLVWCSLPASDLLRPMNWWGLSEQRYGWQFESRDLASYSFLRRSQLSHLSGG